MNTIGGYFLDKMESAVALKENMVIGKRYRFTFLTDRLIRLEYSQSGVFEDRPSQRVVYRNFPKVKFNLTQSETLVQIITSYFTIDYVKNNPFSSSKLTPGNTLKITLNNTDKVWYYPHPEARNFGGITYALDDFAGNLKLGKGLYSTDGFAYIDDSDSLVLDENSNFVKRENKEVDLYVFMYRKDLGLCLQDYYTLTGYPMLVPRYALGVWWYKNQPYKNDEIKNLLENFRENKIALSVVMLGDKCYAEKDPFCFSNDININDLKAVLNSYQVKLGVTAKLDIPLKKGTLSYQNITSSMANIENNYKFLPLDNSKLNIYATYGFRSWISMGADAIYIDYNDVKDKQSLALLDHYAYAMNSLLLSKRSAILSRNHQFATHRNTIIYTGNTKVDWNTLANLPRYYSTASNNGISYIASAIGGYYGGVENFELYIRYIQLGTFSSMLILASDDGKYYKREPWRWDASQLEIIRKFLNMRNALIPYIYTESYIYYKSGSPLIQPLYYKYPKIYDEPLYKNQYFFGSQMLVCPITKRKNVLMNRVVQRLFIPEGTWYEFESGKKYAGNKYYMSFYKDEDYPVFCKEGAIIVLSNDLVSDVPVNVEIAVFPGSDGNYQLYEDDGISHNYKNGSFCITNIDFKYSANYYEFTIQSSGNLGLIPSSRNYKIRFKSSKMANVIVNSGNANFSPNVTIERNDLIICLNNVSTNSGLKIVCDNNDGIINSSMKLVNDDIKGILEDLEIETVLKEKIDSILFSDLPIKKKRIAIRKLKRAGLEPKFEKMFINLLEYIETV